ncbi:MAG: DUF167 domain-containing protein [Thermoleophilia bacterium]
MLTGAPDGTLLRVRVTPGARKSEIAGEAGGRLRVRLQAPPVEGKANRELTKFIAKNLGLKKNRVSLAGGEKSQEKTLLLEGLDLPEARKRLKSALDEE